MESTVDLHSLRTLDLERVYVDEKTMQNLISSCPFVEDVSLSFNDDCLGSLNVCGLVRLLNLTVRRWTYNRYLPMKLSGCQGLQRVTLLLVALDCAFDDANFPQIEFISLTDTIFTAGFKISSHQLKTLIIDDCDKDEELNIFAPNLISVYHGYMSLRHIFLPYLNDHCNLKVQIRVPVGCTVHARWYIRLKEHLQRQKQKQIVEVSFKSLKKVEFNRKKAKKSNYLWTPHVLKCLASEISSVPSKDYAAMMDGFFWCCRPQVLSSSTFSKSFVKFLFKMLKDIEDEGCCSSGGIKCWRHFLKVSDVVIVEGRGGIQEKVPLCWDGFKKAAPDFRALEWVHFHLTWGADLESQNSAKECF